MNYRKEIDGLRAIAIIPVLIFHAEPSWLPSGFIGVDIFLVISGYLITSLILSQVYKGHFSFKNFFARRVRRLLPAFAFMCLVTTVVAVQVLLPTQLEEFSRSQAAAFLFSSNIFFWSELGYFNADSQTKPLLHTWSLSIEEQFYLLYPWLLVAVVKRRGSIQKVGGVLIVLFAFSLGLSLLLNGRSPSAVFFLLPTRAWELLTGAIAATILPQLNLKPIFSFLQGLGGLMILAGFAYITESTPTPGLSTLLPCLGTVLLLMPGVGGHGVFGCLMSSDFLTYIGVRSYSLYLWHWPIMSLYRYYRIEEISSWEAASLLVVSLVAGHLSFKFIEQPARSGSFLAGHARPLAATIGSIGVSVGFFSLVLWSNGLPGRLPEELAYLGLERPKKVRSTGVNKGAPVVLLGDSHAGVLAPEAERYGAYVIASGGFRYLPGFERQGAEWSQLRQQSKRVDDYLEEYQPARIVYVIAWNSAVKANYVRLEDGATVSGEEALFSGLSALAKSHPNMNLVLCSDVAFSDRFDPEWVARKRYLHGERVSGSIPMSEYETQLDAYRKTLDDLDKLENVDVVHLGREFCDSGEFIGWDSGGPLYLDNNHLNGRGLEKLTRLLRQVLRGSGNTRS